MMVVEEAPPTSRLECVTESTVEPAVGFVLVPLPLVDEELLLLPIHLILLYLL